MKTIVYVKDVNDTRPIECAHLVFNVEDGVHVTYLQPSEGTLNFIEFCHANRYGFSNSEGIIEIRVETSNITRISYE